MGWWNTQQTLAKAHGNKAQATKLLGVCCRTLYRMAKQHGLRLGDGYEWAKRIHLVPFLTQPRFPCLFPPLVSNPFAGVPEAPWSGGGVLPPFSRSLGGKTWPGKAWRGFSRPGVRVTIPRHRNCLLAFCILLPTAVGLPLGALLGRLSG